MDATKAPTHVRRRQGLALLAAAVGWLAMAAPAARERPRLVDGPGLDAQSVPTHLQFAGVEIVDAPSPADRIGERPVTVSFLVAGRPSCSAATSGVAYRLLIDADRDARTGARLGVAGEIGADAQLAVTCDAAAGRFVSAVGDVRVTGAGGRTRIDLVTTARRLPSLRFRWIALAQDGPQVTRLPRSGESVPWSVPEMALW